MKRATAIDTLRFEFDCQETLEPGCGSRDEAATVVSRRWLLVWTWVAQTKMGLDDSDQ